MPKHWKGFKNIVFNAREEVGSNYEDCDRARETIRVLKSNNFREKSSTNSYFLLNIVKKILNGKEFNFSIKDTIKS